MMMIVQLILYCLLLPEWSDLRYGAVRLTDYTFTQSRYRRGQSKLA